MPFKTPWTHLADTVRERKCSEKSMLLTLTVPCHNVTKTIKHSSRCTTCTKCKYRMKIKLKRQNCIITTTKIWRTVKKRKKRISSSIFKSQCLQNNKLHKSLFTGALLLFFPTQLSLWHSQNQKRGSNNTGATTATRCKNATKPQHKTDQLIFFFWIIFPFFSLLISYKNA